MRFVFGFFLLFATVASAQENKISVHVYDRPPFVTIGRDGTVGGIVGTRAAKAFAKAGFAVRWVKTPPFRILPILKANQGRDCAPGWYKTSDREMFLNYSAPIYRDQPPTALIRAEYPAPAGITLKDLLTHPDLRLAVRTSTAYGEEIDALIKAMPAERVHAYSTDVAAILKTVHAGHADAIILTSEEVDNLIAEAGFSRADFQLARLSDVKQTEARYIVCSRQVPPQMMDRINKAIRQSFQP